MGVPTCPSCSLADDLGRAYRVSSYTALLDTAPSEIVIKPCVDGSVSPKLWRVGAWRSCMPRWGYAVAGLLIVSLLDACGSSSPPLLQGTIKVDQGANPNLKGDASPIIVRVYELRSPTAFSSADFF